MWISLVVMVAAVAKEPPVCSWVNPDYLRWEPIHLVTPGGVSVVVGLGGITLSVWVDAEGHTQAMAQDESVEVWGQTHDALLIPQHPIRLGDGIVADWTAELSVAAVRGGQLVVAPEAPPFELLAPAEATVECDALGLKRTDLAQFSADSHREDGDAHRLDRQRPVDVRGSPGGTALVRLPAEGTPGFARVLATEGEWSRVHVWGGDYLVEGWVESQLIGESYAMGLGGLGFTTTRGPAAPSPTHVCPESDLLVLIDGNAHTAGRIHEGAAVALAPRQGRVVPIELPQAQWLHTDAKDQVFAIWQRDARRCRPVAEP